MEFKTIIDKIIEGGKLILAQPTFIFKDGLDLPSTDHIVTREEAGRIDLIARDEYGSSTDMEFILKFNGISDPFSINEGDVLKIPVPDSTIKKLERPGEVQNDIVRQEFVDGKKLTKKDKRRIDFLKKKYKIKEVLPPNMLKSGFSNSKIVKDENGENITKMGMDVGTPDSNFVKEIIDKSKGLGDIADSITDSITGKLKSNSSEQLTDAEIAKLERSGLDSTKAIKLATTFDGAVIGSDVASTSNFSSTSSESLDENGNKVGNQSVNQSEQIEGDKITKTTTKTIVKPDGSSETTQTVTFSKYEDK